MTVSRALRGDRRYVSATTADRIRESARQLGYDAARFEGARRLVLGSHDLDVLNHAVALYFPDQSITAPYFMRIFQGIITVLHEQEIAMVTNLVTKPDASGNVQLPHIIRRGDVDGAMVYCATAAFMPILTALREEPHFHHRPVISILNPIPGCSVVMTDDWTGAFEAVTHLFALGHRRILHCYGDWNTAYPHQQRLGGMRQACEVAGKTPADALRVTPWNYDDPPEAAQRIIRLLTEDPTITAIMAPNDAAAIVLWHAVTTHGWRIPEDISLIGHDDSDSLLAMNGENILTTVSLPLEELGRVTADQLVRKIHGHIPDVSKQILPVTLTLRATTAPPPVVPPSLPRDINILSGVLTS